MKNEDIRVSHFAFVALVPNSSPHVCIIVNLNWSIPYLLSQFLLVTEFRKIIRGKVDSCCTPLSSIVRATKETLFTLSIFVNTISNGIPNVSRNSIIWESNWLKPCSAEINTKHLRSSLRCLRYCIVTSPCSGVLLTPYPGVSMIRNLLAIL